MKWTSKIEKEFKVWKSGGNVQMNPDGSYSTQDAQWRNRLKDLDALKSYYLKEFFK